MRLSNYLAQLLKLQPINAMDHVNLDLSYVVFKLSSCLHHVENNMMMLN